MAVRKSRKVATEKQASPPKPRATRAAARAAERARALKERENSAPASRSASISPATATSCSRTTVVPTKTTTTPKVETKTAAKRKRGSATAKPKTAAASRARKVTFESEDESIEQNQDKEDNIDGTLDDEKDEKDEKDAKRRKIIVVDYMKHASQETKQRRATSTARKEQVGVEQQQQLSEEMRSMIGKGRRKSALAADDRSEDLQSDSGRQDGNTCFIDDSLLPFVVEDSSSAVDTGTEMAIDTDDSDINATDSPAKYLRKRFARDERRRQSNGNRSKNSNPYTVTHALLHDTIDDTGAVDDIDHLHSDAQQQQQQEDNNVKSISTAEQTLAKGQKEKPETQSRLLKKKPLPGSAKFLSARHNRTHSPPPSLEDVTDEPILREPPASHHAQDKDKAESAGCHVCTCGAGATLESRQSTVGESVVRLTGSDTLKKRDYSQFVDHRFHDASYKSDVLKERDMVKALCAHIAARENKSLKEAEMTLESRGYGKRAITMESFDIRRQTYGNSNYPTSTRLRCCYDHHTFDTIPILVPIKYYEDRNILTVFSNWVFCSFSCLVAWIQRDAPLVVRKGECIQMATFMARKFFGITDRIYPAPFRQQHVAYGGRLTTEQWRSLCTTHCSFLQYPLAVSVPCTIVTEITLQKRLDRDVLARIAKRTEEAHANAGPEKPEFGDPDAKGAYKRGKKEGKGRPMKRRTMKDPSGQMVTLDKSFLDQVINKARNKKEDKAAPATGIQALMGIKTKPS